MPEFAGVNHVALTVRDLEVSERFYVDVLGFTVVLDIGHGRVCLHKRTGFSLALLRWSGPDAAPFSERVTGLDHLSFRDPDGIALELNAPTPVYLAALEQLRTTDPTDDEVRAAAAQLLGSELVARSSPS